MCGRYNFDIGQSRALRAIVREMEGHKLSVTGEIRPTDRVPVLVAEGGRIRPMPMAWGFPRPDGGGVVINARSETALEKRMFRESLLHRRCIVPCAGFYEWSRNSGCKTKHLLRLPGQTTLYMAGVHNRFLGEHGWEDRFVILTTAANDSMREEDTGALSLFSDHGNTSPLIHDRMPVVLLARELAAWLKPGADPCRFFDRREVLLCHTPA